MFTGLRDIDWSSMHHAYGPAEEVPDLLEAMASSDADERDKALSEFHGAVHHQGDVYRCTVLAMPFLFELAEGSGPADRAGIVGLLVSIGEIGVERGDEMAYAPSGELADYDGARAMARERAETFVTFTTDDDPQVRLAAMPALALFLDDGARAASLLRERLTAELGVMERLKVVETMADLALRVPSTAPEAMVWLAGLAAGSGVDPQTRLAALTHHARCAPDRIDDELVPAAMALLRQIAEAPTPAAEWASSPREKPATAPSPGVPPQIAAAFEALEESGTVYAPTTALLRTLHQLLGSRTTQRAVLLTEQLNSPDPGSRLDAVRMAGNLMNRWSGDHEALLLQVAVQLRAGHQLAAEAAAVLEACSTIAEPAREALADLVAAHRAEYGPDVWAAEQPRLRRAHQEAVRALARLGDERALPSLLCGLDTGVDAWRAVHAARHLPQAAGQLAPRLGGHLARVDIAGLRTGADMGARALLSTLGTLREPGSVPVIMDALAAAVRHEKWGVATSALDALKAMGSAATPALTAIRGLTDCGDSHVRTAAANALWAVAGDPREMMPVLLAHLEGYPNSTHAAADILGEIGPDAAVALPHLRELMTDGYEWTRVHAAAAVWRIGGDAEAPAVLEVLLGAWAKNQFTSTFVVKNLESMGLAAAAALPRLRAAVAEAPHGSDDPWSGGARSAETLQRDIRRIIARLESEPAPGGRQG